MLVLQGSNFITSIVIGLLLLLSPVSSVADGGFCDYSNINEPIGIDLGYQYIAASYANSSTLFTPLAVVNNAEYSALVSQLAAEDFERSDLKSIFGNRDRSAYALLKVIISRLTSKLTAKIPYINRPYVEFITGGTSQVYVSLATQFRRFVDTALRRSQKRPNPPILPEVSETFIRMFQGLQASAIADTGTKLSFAIIGIPDFFNETINEIVVDASRKAGIETPSHALPRSLLTHFENPTIREGATILVLHQGFDHCGIRVYFEGVSGSSSNKSSRRWNATKEALQNPVACDAYLRLDPWRSEFIHRRLTESPIRSNQELQTQLEVRADRHVLVASVAQARLQLKRQDVSVVYLGTESRSADFYTTIAENCKGEYLAGVPLELDKWWLYGSNPGVKLTREMVLATDEEYVKGLANTINFFLRATQEVMTSPAEFFDQVAILTDWVDGDLARRAVKEVLGDSVPILGGSLRELQWLLTGQRGCRC